MSSNFHLGLDFGTSGARACVIAEGGQIEEFAKLEYGPQAGHEFASSWRTVLFDLVAGLPISLRKRLAGIAIDGTSATVLACDADLRPLHAPLLYNDNRARLEAETIVQAAGREHPAATPTSGLAKVLWLNRHLNAGKHIFLNQADWLAGLLSGQAGISDYHNALKMGFDVQAARWPGWLSPLTDPRHLPRVLAPGTPIGALDRSRAHAFGIPTDCVIRTGTTDSIAAFLATGATRTGDAVTSLGSTLVLKLISPRRIDSARHGIYSHWFGDRWLAGGASNCGGAVLKQFFSADELATFSARIEPNRDTGLDYYPLPQPGERFPINDPTLPPRLEPRPETRVEFLQALLEGLARVEAQGYRKLTELGAEMPSRVISMGGGAGNLAYSRIRSRYLGLPVVAAEFQEAAYGSARLARFSTALMTGAQP